MATAPDVQHAPSGKSKKSKKNRCQSGPPTAMMPNKTAMGGAVGGAPGQAATRQLEFHQAMADFKTMFPTMDKDVIETVLRANNGAVDVTIDQLLTLAADMPEKTPEPPQHPLLPQYGDPMNMGFSSPPPGTAPMTADRGPTAMLDNPPPYSPPSPNSPFSQEMRKRQVPQTPLQSGPPQSTPTQFTPSSAVMAPPPALLFPSRPVTATPPAPAPVPRHSRWNPPLLGNLPSDFLRVVPAKTTQNNSVPRVQQNTMVSAELQQRMEKNVRQRKSIDINDVEMQQMLEDERFALTLQNEEFLQELQRNPEFIAALNSDYSQSVMAAAAPTQFPDSARGSIQASQVTAGALPQAELGASGGISTDDIEFRNKLSHMGKTTRYKFAQMAKKFNKKKKRSSKPQLEGLPAASTMNLLDDYDVNGDSALLGTRQEVQENFYSDSKSFQV